MKKKNTDLDELRVKTPLNTALQFTSLPTLWRAWYGVSQPQGLDRYASFRPYRQRKTGNSLSMSHSELERERERERERESTIENKILIWRRE